MKKTDGRKFTTEVQQQIRYMLIKLCKSEKTYVESAKISGVVLETIRKWWNLYKNGSYQNLKIKKRVVQPGINCKLNAKQTNILKQLLIEKIQDKLGLEFSLWTSYSELNI